MFKAQPYTSSMHPIVAEWWTGHKWPVLPDEMLPKSGIMICYEDTPIAVGFIYKTDSSIAMMEYIVSDPKSVKHVRDIALDLLLDKLVAKAKELGFKHIFTTAVHPKLIEREMKHGFIVGDTNSTQLVRSL